MPIIIPFLLSLIGCSPFFLGLNTSLGVPYCEATASLNEGGRPESLSPTRLPALQRAPLHLLTLHFQGHYKHHIAYDLCRLFLSSGDGGIHRLEVQELCEIELSNRKRGGTTLPCLTHQVYRANGVQDICF